MSVSWVVSACGVGADLSGGAVAPVVGTLVAIGCGGGEEHRETLDEMAVVARETDVLRRAAEAGEDGLRVPGLAEQGAEPGEQWFPPRANHSGLGKSRFVLPAGRQRRYTRSRKIWTSARPRQSPLSLRRASRIRRSVRSLVFVCLRLRHGRPRRHRAPALLARRKPQDRRDTAVTPPTRGLAAPTLRDRETSPTHHGLRAVPQLP